ncbi:uncharacterized protein A4U43_C07F14510 [Asparagus officinalis]|uniref:Uncharacterized protein n=1 Tax=Asparagus officinalis TaxID=4686 RepID=A0A5P1EBY9_ASPOF|nr:uncharacterized protein A4U43_C07F14510 [Asparagus officinalis]
MLGRCLGERRVRQIQRALRNGKLTVLCLLMTFIVLRGTIGAGNSHARSKTSRRSGHALPPSRLPPPPGLVEAKPPSIDPQGSQLATRRRRQPRSIRNPTPSRQDLRLGPAAISCSTPPHTGLTAIIHSRQAAGAPRHRILPQTLREPRRRSLSPKIHKEQDRLL